jgi:hypothetical protein
LIFVVGFRCFCIAEKKLDEKTFLILSTLKKMIVAVYLTFLIKPSQPADFFVREKVALNNNNAFWLELSNAFDCVSQKENIEHPK